MSATAERRPATTIGELDLHLSYMQQAIQSLTEAISGMATKQDIKELEQRMSAFATKDELAAVEARLQKETMGSTFDRLLSLITRLGTAAAVIAGACAAIAAAVHFYDSIKAVVH